MPSIDAYRLRLNRTTAAVLEPAESLKSSLHTDSVLSGAPADIKIVHVKSIGLSGLSTLAGIDWGESIVL
jgi:hypothetical protein